MQGAVVYRDLLHNCADRCAAWQVRARRSVAIARHTAVALSCAWRRGVVAQPPPRRVDARAVGTGRRAHNTPIRGMRQSENDPPRPPLDPFALARGDPRGRLPRRFYKHASVAQVADGFVLSLDGKHAHTPRRRPLAFRLPALAEMVAAEWQAQSTYLNPTTMPITKIVQTGLDFVAADRAMVQADIVRFACSDLLCYRAPAPASLVRAQAVAWDPVLDWARTKLNAGFVVAEGILYVAQPEPVLDRVREAVARCKECEALAALATLTTLTGSALLALAVANGQLSAREAWDRAHVDEYFQESQWGIDAEAQNMRALRWLEMEAASKIIALFPV
jgi:chaperone required for assembly of F1-ATPase